MVIWFQFTKYSFSQAEELWAKDTSYLSSITWIQLVDLKGVENLEWRETDAGGPEGKHRKQAEKELTVPASSVISSKESSSGQSLFTA